MLGVRKIFVNTAIGEEYLTIEETGARLKLKPKSVKNKMAAGIFQKGVHYYSPEGIGPRFKWSAVQAWLEGIEAHEQGAIPMKRGYTLNTPVSDLWKNGDHH